MNRKVSIYSKFMSIVLVLSLLVPIFPAATLAEEDADPAEIVYDFRHLGYSEEPGQPGEPGNPGDPEGWELIGSPNDSPKLTRQGYGARMGTNPNYSSMKARSFQVPVPKAGTYAFKFSGYLSGGGGTGELKIDDTVIGQYSFHSPTGQHGPILEMDRKMNLSEGNHTLTLTIVSDTPSSPSMYPTQLILQEVETELEEVIVTPAQAALEIQETTELFVSARMADGNDVNMTEADVTFVSSDPAIVEVDSSGIVTALASGHADVIVEVTFEGVTKQALVPIEVLSLYREFIYDFRKLGYSEEPGQPGVPGNPGDPEGWELIGSPNDSPKLTRQGYGARMGTNPNYSSMKARSFQVPVPKAGTYQFKFSGYLSGGGGTGELKINDTAIGQYSFYSPTGQHGPILEMDRKMNLSAGNHTLTLTIVSDTPSSPSMYPTQLILQEVEPELDIVTAVASETRLYVDETAQLQVTGALTDGSEADLQHADIQFTSLNTEILDVDTAGLVTALAGGHAAILVEVTLDGVTKQTEIEFDVMSAPLDRLELVVENTEIMNGQQQFALVEAYLSNEMLLKLDPSQISWASSDETIATVNEYGFIQAKGNGTATISASVTIRDQTKDASIMIEIVDKEPQPVNISTDRWAVIPEITSAPVIDGDLADSVWQDASSLQGFYSVYYHERSEAASEVKMAYDDQQLYMSLSFEDTEQAIENLGVMIRTPDATGSEYHYLRIPVAQYGLAVAHDWGPGRKTISGHTLETSIQGNMIHAEVAIPLAALEVDGVQEGDEWGLNVIVQQAPGEGALYSWIPARSSAFVDDYRDSIDMWADISDEGRMGSFFTGQLPLNGQPWQPEEAVLEYDGYREKTLTLQASESLAHVTQNDLNLLWKSPLGTWEEVNSVQLLDVDQDSNSVSVSFQHPQPKAKGTYQLFVSIPIAGSNDRRVAILTFDRENMIEAGNSYHPDAYGAKVEQTPVELVPASEKIEQLWELIPDKTGVLFAGLPELPELNPNGLYTFDPASPHQLTSSHSNLVYPNEQYPEDQVMTVENKQGEIIEIPYYEDAEGKQYFISAHLWYQQREYVLKELPKVAAEDPLGAARLLYRFAEVYENYVPMNDYMWRNYPVKPAAGPPYPYWGGTWNRWNVYELTSSRMMAQAFEIINQTDAFEALSYEVGEDVKKKIVDDMFEPTIDFTRSYPSRNQNYTSWLGLTDFGRALNNSAYIHQSVERIEAYVAERFLFDGFQNTTSVSYHNPAINGVNLAMNNLAGWSDPEAYVSPLTGLSLENFDMRQNFPAISKSEEIPHMLIYGNGHYFPTQDTWAYQFSRTPNYEAGSFLLPASGVARLSRGDGTESSQVFLGFQTKYGHSHRDPLNITYFAEGQELLPDIGYTHTLYRKWTSSTLGHNTVVVDGSDMPITSQTEHGGNIDVFATFDEDVQVVRASQETAYAQTETYKREPWFIRFPDSEDEKGYVLDLFRVSGGDRHEFTLNGDANRDSYFETDHTLSDYGPYLLPEGTEVIMPEAESDYGSAEGHYYGYIYVQDVESARVDDGNYQLTLVTEENGQEMAKMNIIGVTNAGDNELFIGKSPSLRATRLNGTSMDNNIEAQKYTMPKMVLRREGQDLQSHFVTAMEPYASGSEARIDSVTLLPIDQGSEGDLAVAVTYGDYTDIILSSLDDQQPLVAGDMTLTGKMGIIRLHLGLVQSMNLVGGTLLQKGQLSVTDTGAVEGTITDVRRKVSGAAYDAFVTDTAVSPDLAGQHIVVTHTNGKTFGYKIAEIITEGSQTVIRLDGMDPGFTIHSDGSSSLQFLPFTRWSGTPTFRIENTAQEIPDQELDVATIQRRMAYFGENQGFTNENSERALNLHLTAVSHFEKQGNAAKVNEHLRSFHVMLEQFREKGLITEKAYEVLVQDTEALIGRYHQD